MNTQHSTFPTISVIMTVYNEAGTIARLLNSLRGQTLQPDEIVICDGGSSDETVVIIRQMLTQESFPPTRLLLEPGANISHGRNVAIDAANGPIIAVTDAGVRLEATWLESITAPWRDVDNEDVLASAGFFVPDVDGVFETAMAATVLPLRDEIDPQKFLPSSRSVAFTKDAWRAAGGYPEWLDYCEDLLFDFAINELGNVGQKSAFHWSPDAVAYFRPRTSFASFWRQYYLYARGDGKADLWRKRQVARYVTYLIVLPLLLALAFAGGGWSWLGWLGLLLGVVAYCWRPWIRLNALGREFSVLETVQAVALVPLIRGVGDVAKMCGYPVGLLWRWRNRGRAEIHWQAPRDVLADS